RVNPDTRPFLVSSRKFAPRCKESDGSHNALRVAVRCTRLTWEAAIARGLFRCERRYDFFEARITARFSAQKRRAFFQSARRFHFQDPPHRVERGIGTLLVSRIEMNQTFNESLRDHATKSAGETWQSLRRTSREQA